MPLEFCFAAMGEPRELDDEVLGDEAREVDNTLVEPNRVFFLKEFSAGDARVVAVHCSADDEGGRIVTLPAEGVLEDLDFDTYELDADDLPQPISNVSIGSEGSDYPLEVQTEDGKRFTMLVRHVANNAITPSCLVPLGLIYPDTSVHLSKAYEY